MPQLKISGNRSSPQRNRTRFVKTRTRVQDGLRVILRDKCRPHGSPVCFLDGVLYKLPQLMDALDVWTSTTAKTVMIEYIVIGGLNDSPEVAHTLGKLLQGRRVYLNLIPYNPTDAGRTIYRGARYMQ